jgi:hypothetical protein
LKRKVKAPQLGGKTVKELKAEGKQTGLPLRQQSKRLENCSQRVEG